MYTMYIDMDMYAHVFACSLTHVSSRCLASDALSSVTSFLSSWLFSLYTGKSFLDGVARLYLKGARPATNAPEHSLAKEQSKPLGSIPPDKHPFVGNVFHASSHVFTRLTQRRM